MGPKTPVAQSSELFRQPLCKMLKAKHPLVKLTDVIDWEEIERSFGAHFQSTLAPSRYSCFHWKAWLGATPASLAARETLMPCSMARRRLGRNPLKRGDRRCTACGALWRGSQHKAAF